MTDFELSRLPKAERMVSLQANDLMVTKYDKKGREIQIDFTSFLGYGKSFDENEAKEFLSLLQQFNTDKDVEHLSDKELKKIMNHIGIKDKRVSTEDFRQYLEKIIDESELTPITETAVNDKGETVTTTTYPRSGIVERKTTSKSSNKVVTTYENNKEGDLLPWVEDRFGRLNTMSEWSTVGNKRPGASTYEYFPSNVKEYKTDNNWTIQVYTSYTGGNGTSMTRKAFLPEETLPDGNKRQIIYQDWNLNMKQEIIKDPQGNNLKMHIGDATYTWNNDIGDWN